MSFFYLDPRSDNDYGESECDGTEPSLPGCSDILLFPVVFVACSSWDYFRSWR